MRPVRIRALTAAVGLTLAACASTTPSTPPTDVPSTTVPVTSHPPVRVVPKVVEHKADLPIVHGGAFCSEKGAIGATSKGTPMMCQVASDGRLRWKKA